MKCRILKLILLCESVLYHTTSFFVFKTSEHIAIYTNVIAQDHLFEHNKVCNMFKPAQFKMVICEKRIQSETRIWEILVTFCDVLLCFIP